MEALHFCKDGILRRSFSGYDARAKKHHSYRVPMQVYINCVDPDAFLKSLHSIIVFEEGLTVGEMMENLAPWEDVMTGVACLDFPAFLKEVRQTPAEITEIVDRISLTYTSSISAVPRFDRSNIIDRKGVFNIGRPVVTDLLNLESGWSMEACLTEAEVENYEGSKSISLSYTPMSEWKHLPIIVETTSSLFDDTAGRHTQSYLSSKKSLTKSDHPLVERITGRSGAVLKHRMPLAAPSPTFFDALICGFLWDVGFHYSPVVRDATAADLKEQVEELDLQLKEGSEIPETTGSLESYNDQRDKEFEYFEERMVKIEAEAKRLDLPVTKPTPIH